MFQKIKEFTYTAFGSICHFVKKETVLTIAAILAAISSFFVKPCMEYLDYIDWRVLGILLSLMLVVAGFQKNGLFDYIGKKLLLKTKNTVQLMCVLVFLCFFSSMLITNDVSLLTFVPFALVILQKAKQEKLMIPVLVLQTIAANLGSMLTPIGNPQNLYLYNLAGVDIMTFMGWMLPYTVLSGVALFAVIMFISAGNRKNIIQDVMFSQSEVKNDMRKNVIYSVLFILSLLVVTRLIPYYVVLPIILIAVFVFDRDVLLRVDYCLLLTFISFFIFIGNMGNLPVVRDTLQSLVEGREVGIGIAASQIVSNVPAALLLSGFTKAYKALTLGVNIGGLGTLIASMASLISYKIYAHNYNKTKGIYLLWFTVANVLFLVALVLVYWLIS